MLRHSLQSRFLALALLLSVAFGHLYGAWHGVAHFGHQAHASNRTATASEGPVFSATAQALVAQWSALKVGAGEHSESGHHHSCISLDSLCAGLTPVSAGLGCPVLPSPISLAIGAPLPLLGHLAWVHASARAPPGISIA
jgi:hypothetical protein